MVRKGCTARLDKTSSSAICDKQGKESIKTELPRRAVSLPDDTFGLGHRSYGREGGYKACYTEIHVLMPILVTSISAGSVLAADRKKGPSGCQKGPTQNPKGPSMDKKAGAKLDKQHDEFETWREGKKRAKGHIGTTYVLLFTCVYLRKEPCI